MRSTNRSSGSSSSLPSPLPLVGFEYFQLPDWHQPHAPTNHSITNRRTADISMYPCTCSSVGDLSQRSHQQICSTVVSGGLLPLPCTHEASDRSRRLACIRMFLCPFVQPRHPCLCLVALSLETQVATICDTQPEQLLCRKKQCYDGLLSSHV